MIEQEAMHAIADAFRKTVKKDEDIKITLDTDFIKEELLDSLDGMVFIMELSEITGKTFPEEDLVKLGFYRVRHLVEFLTA